MAIGVAASWLLGRSMNGLLYGVTATDAVTFAVMLSVPAVVAAIAGDIPA
jgi:hypothetical protein